MDKISSGVYKILSGAGTCGRALNLRGVVHGALQNEGLGHLERT
ncbi:hypothetical protein [uncultured Campylobacter sp.]|nr:hypothetical protein [uncultured Campylobacter sp.]